jgi:hypothetical protein
MQAGHTEGLKWAVWGRGRVDRHAVLAKALRCRASLANTTICLKQISCSPFWEDGRIWLHKDPSPIVLQLKQKRVRVQLEIVCASLNEKSIFHLESYKVLSFMQVWYLPLKEDSVDVLRLPELAPKLHLLSWDGEVVREEGGRSGDVSQQVQMPDYLM